MFLRDVEWKLEVLEARILDLGPSVRGSWYGDEVLSTGSLELFKGAVILILLRLWIRARVWLGKVREVGEGLCGERSLGRCLGASKAEEVEASARSANQGGLQANQSPPNGALYDPRKQHGRERRRDTEGYGGNGIYECFTALSS